ncbi:hypothetical protein D1815_08400 [Aquimarina sp. AD1]|uniref:hypothetical protein n=1 Tax=Aquimarina TaxID=290174 RepID=UPI00040CC0D3|nr:MULTISPECIES: hypothetical protein [Aquimarina]AXT55766.1 hypothetical protein D1815_08400 [Aquimarina sp. AD1]RKN31380.1 hypothetical protein D7035_06060 [Aquimarina sp. AD1]
MTNDQKDPLFVLVKSLSKSEKRQFKVYVGRLGVNTDSKFLALFNHLDKSETLDEELIVAKGIVKKQQLSNLKAHLYKQILISLRLSPLHQNVRSQIREQLDFATILYHKGLYKQSLKILDKAKTLAKENEENNIAYEIVELEKVIETQYITRSINSRADELTIEAKMLSMKNVLTSRLSNLSLQLYGLMIKSGYVRNDKEHNVITNYFESKLPKYDWNILGFREKLWLYKAHLWYSFMVQDFLSCYKYSKKWVDLFYENPKMIILNPVFFLRGNHYLLESLYLIQDKTQLKLTLSKFEKTIKSDDFPIDDNIEVLSFQFIYNNRLNVHFLEGTFDEGEYLVTEILDGITEYKNRLDDHHIMVLYYKIGCLYFGMADHRKCIEYLSKIINNKSLKMREDLMCFARVLSLVAHYEAGMDYHLETQLKETYRFLIKMDDLYEVQKEMIKFLKNLGDIFPHQIKDEFRKLHKTLKQYEDHPYEKRAFLYLDILSWLESNIESRPVADIIKEKSKKLVR